MIRIVAAATIDFSLIQARLPIESQGGWLSGRYFTVCHWQQPYWWAWLPSLAVHDHSFVLKHSILYRLFEVQSSQTSHLSHVFKGRYTWVHIRVNISRKLIPKWGVGWYSVVGPLSRGYGKCRKSKQCAILTLIINSCIIKHMRLYLHRKKICT